MSHAPELSPRIPSYPNIRILSHPHSHIPASQHICISTQLHNRISQSQSDTFQGESRSDSVRVGQNLKAFLASPVLAGILFVRCWVGTTHCQLGKARRNCIEVFGERLVRFLGGHGALCTDRRATCLGRATNSQELRTSMIATTRILFSKLATARLFCYPPTTPNSLMAPSLSSRHLSVPTISSDKGSGTILTASDSGHIEEG